MAIAESFPDIGSSTDPGRNTIRNNGRYDINNAVENRQTIPAYGNVLGNNRLHGSIDLAGRIQVPRRPAAIAPKPSQRRNVGILREAELSAESTAPRNQTREEPENPLITATGGIEIPVPPPASEERESERETGAGRPRLLDRILPNRRRDRSLEESNISRSRQTTREAPPIPGVIRVPVPTTESGRSQPSRQRRLPRSIPPLSSPDLLRVPGPNIPLGSGGYVPPGIGMGPSPFPRDSRSGSTNRGNSRALALGFAVSSSS